MFGKKKIAYGGEEKQAIAVLKDAITTAPGLISADRNKPFVSFTDASDEGLGAVLMQSEKQGEDISELHAGKTRTLPQRPQSDGLAERTNHTLKKALRMYITDPGRQDWAESLPFLVFSMNTTVTSAPSYTPFRLCHRRKAISPLDDQLMREFYEEDAANIPAYAAQVEKT